MKGRCAFTDVIEPSPLACLSCVFFLLVAGSGEGQDAGDDEIGGLLRGLRDKVSCAMLRLLSNRPGLVGIAHDTVRT